MTSLRRFLSLHKRQVFWLSIVVITIVVVAIMSLFRDPNYVDSYTLEYYKDNCYNVNKIDREDYYRNPGNYEDDKVVIYGNVVSYSPVNTFIMYIDDGFWVVLYDMPEQNRVLQGDLVAFYGTLDGLKVMTRNIDGVDREVEVPCVQAKYVEHR